MAETLGILGSSTGLVAAARNIVNLSLRDLCHLAGAKQTVDNPRRNSENVRRVGDPAAAKLAPGGKICRSFTGC
ncbi:MAG: hypothetical protein HZA66_06895 [Rhodopseudomonas palustris]|uniref:Uncharacterized protein n=1 Tax=Rhodopseudomonas palustris TaxID=1076 RepID=A0A933RVV3_RHOPL|nr:hypothetical protein [Rhodopseudomonas palustris]